MLPMRTHLRNSPAQRSLARREIPSSFQACRAAPALCGLVVFLAGAPLWAGPAEFNGRWNLTVEGDNRGRVWWLEVEGAGTPNLHGRFVGAPGGQMDVIPKMYFDGAELVWEFERAYQPNEKNTQRARGVYRAREANGVLTGSFDIAGRNARLVFTGKRAPVLEETSKGRWTKGKPVELFNGRDMSGWEVRIPGREMDWKVEDGLMKNGARAPDITSAQKFWNFLLHVEYKVAQKSNSGIGLRGRYEIQIYGDHGEAPSLHSNGALYSRIAPAVNATLAPQEWQVFDITLIGRELTVVLNGKTLIDRREVEGLTAMATDPNEDQPGPITLQGDHGPVAFRKITVTPLTK